MEKKAGWFENAAMKDFPTEPLIVKEYSLNVRTHEVSKPGREKIRLSPVQFDLLSYLMSHPDEILSPGRLLVEVWGYPENTGSHALVRMHIKKLRQKIETDPGKPSFIRTIAGYGYTVGIE